MRKISDSRATGPSGSPSLPEGDLTIARQFTAGMRFLRAQVPKGRLIPWRVVCRFLFVSLREHDIDQGEQTSWGMIQTQPSLRDLGLPQHRPTLERVGYSRISLREKANSNPAPSPGTASRNVRTPILPEGDLTIARQFTAGMRFLRAEVPKGRLIPSPVLFLLRFGSLNEHNTE